MVVRTTILTSICFTLIATAAFGQGMSARDIWRHSADRIEMLKLWRIIDELEIEEEQAVELFPYWSKNQRDKRELGEERGGATHALRQLLKSEATSDGELDKQIERIRAIDKQMFELNRSFRDGLKKHLDVRQRARLAVFEERFRGDLRDMVRGFRLLGDRPRRGERPDWGEVAE